MSANLLTELQAEIAETRDEPSAERETCANQELAERLGLSMVQLKQLLADLEAQPRVTRETFLRRVVEAWLSEQREAYRMGAEIDNGSGLEWQAQRDRRVREPARLLAQAAGLRPEDVG